MVLVCYVLSYDHVIQINDVIDEGETEEGEYGFWVFDEETGEEGVTGLYTENEFWVLGAKVLQERSTKRLW